MTRPVPTDIVKPRYANARYVKRRIRDFVLGKGFVVSIRCWEVGFKRHSKDVRVIEVDECNGFGWIGRYDGREG